MLLSILAFFAIHVTLGSAKNLKFRQAQNSLAVAPALYDEQCFYPQPDVADSIFVRLHRQRSEEQDLPDDLMLSRNIGTGATVRTTRASGVRVRHIPDCAVHRQLRRAVRSLDLAGLGHSGAHE